MLLSHSSCQHPQSVNDLAVEHVKGSRLGLEDKALLGEGGAGGEEGEGEGKGGAGGGEGKGRSRWMGRGRGRGGAGGWGGGLNATEKQGRVNRMCRVSSLLRCTTMRKQSG